MKRNRVSSALQESVCCYFPPVTMAWRFCSSEGKSNGLLSNILWLVFSLMPVLINGQVPDSGFLARKNALRFITYDAFPAAVPLSGDNYIAPLIVSADDFPGVLRVAGHLADDFKRVTGREPALHTHGIPAVPSAIIAGTLGKSPVIDKMVAAGKINVDDIRGNWENSLIQTVENPLPGISKALVIVGSDKRGTIFGIFELSAQMGVSPWYWWADVPVKKHPELYAKPGRYDFGVPKVKYRGIFINDEAPALAGWAHEKFGKFNRDFYAHVFELILRMKGNFLWPAMWGRSIYDDDPESPGLADEYGVVLSTSHHEPMMRAHVEWQRYGEGAWNYQTNAAKLRDFWKTGIERMGSNESIVTLAMRGDGDEPMSNDRNIELLTRIVDDQRKIIGEVTGKPAGETPQVWALYKEVQDYYDMGMRVPDDVTLLYCDDNWGNVRRVPGDKEKLRAGGSGMYYHFDYVGGPRNYKWLNTNPLPRIWEQMKLSFEYNIDRLWVVNVGDIKPMELPTSFFLDMAWDPEAMSAVDMNRYTLQWAKDCFGPEYARETDYLLSGYTAIFGRRKPELVDWNTYSLINYRDFERAVAEFNELALLASAIAAKLDPEYLDAWYQLVQYPVEAGANLYNLYYATVRNHLYARQGRSKASIMADSVRYFFERDAAMTHFFHTGISGGKWNHMMSQTRIGYTYWQEPRENVMPRVQIPEIPDMALPDILVEGREEPGNGSLPVFDPFHRQSFYVELFNKGSRPYDFSSEVSAPWVKIDKSSGRVNDQIRIMVSVDWDKAPVGDAAGKITLLAAGSRFEVEVPVKNPSPGVASTIHGFIESNGYISIEAEHFISKRETGGVSWNIIPGLGKSKSGVIALPYQAGIQQPGNGSRLDYPVHITGEGGEVTVYAHFSPTLNYTGGSGFEYAVSFDDQTPVRVNIHPDPSNRAWERDVAANVSVGRSAHKLTPGNHMLHFHMVNPGLVLQKLVIDTGGLKRSYLGPEESYFQDKSKNH